MHKLVIFDLDGTLVDTVALVVEAVTDTFEQFGQPVPDEMSIRSISGLNIQNGIRSIAPHANGDTVLELAQHYRTTYLEKSSRSMREALFPGVKETLEALHGRKDVLLAVATGKPLGATRRVLHAHGLTDLFTSVQTPDTNRSKPDPEMIETAMEIANVSETGTIMIGDTTHDMEMSRAAGVRALGVAWGYHKRADLIEAGADRVIGKPEYMIGAIDQLLGGSDA